MITNSGKETWQQKKQWDRIGGDREVGLGVAWTKFEKGMWGLGKPLPPSLASPPFLVKIFHPPHYSHFWKISSRPL